MPSNLTITIGCSSLTNVQLSPTSQLQYIRYVAFEYCTSLVSFTIPNGVLSIEDDAFSSCSSLIAITIPSNVTSIGQYTFSSCSSLQYVSIPASVTSIGNSIYYQFLCKVTQYNHHLLGSYAFQNCPVLTCINWDPSITRSLGYDALPTTAVCPPSKAPTLAPSLFPTKTPTISPSYLPGNPTPNPTVAPTSSPTATMVTCTSNEGHGCCSLCGSGPCTMTFSSAVNYIGTLDKYHYH